MDFIDSIILGVIEGITEFLPISSTGHLMLAGSVLGLPDGEFEKSFNIAIQLGAILSVVFLYWRELVKIPILKKLLAGFLPTATIGLVLYKPVKHFLLGSTEVVLSALFLGGVFLIVFELWRKKMAQENGAEESPTGLDNISYKQSVIIGLFQSIAIIPGVSRSASTIIGGLFLGLSRKTIVEFSFLLAVPTMMGATALDLYKSVSSFSSEGFVLLAVGFIVAFFTAIFSIKFLLAFTARRTFISFGVYRIVLSIIFFLFFF